MALSGSPLCSALQASSWRSIAASKPRSGSSSVPILSVSAASRPKSGEGPSEGRDSRPKMSRKRFRTNGLPLLRTRLSKYSRVGARDPEPYLRRTKTQVVLPPQPRVLGPPRTTEQAGSTLGERKTPARGASISLPPGLSALQLLGAKDLRFALSLHGAASRVQRARPGTVLEGRDEVVRGHYGVAESQVDSLGADRRHRVRGVADEQNPRRGPLRGASHEDVQLDRTLDLVAVGEYVVGQPRGRRPHRLGQPVALADPAEATLGQYETVLQASIPGCVADGGMLSGGHHDHDRASVPERGGRRELEPEHVVLLGQQLEIQTRARAHQRSTSVAADDQIRSHLLGTVFRLQLHPDDTIAEVADQTVDPRAPLEHARWISACFLDHPLQERGLRYDAHRAVAEFLGRLWYGEHLFAVDVDVPGAHPAVGDGRKLPLEPHLVQSVHPRGHQSLAAEHPFERRFSLD